MYPKSSPISVSRSPSSDKLQATASSRVHTHICCLCVQLILWIWCDQRYPEIRLLISSFGRNCATKAEISFCYQHDVRCFNSSEECWQCVIIRTINNVSLGSNLTLPSDANVPKAELNLNGGRGIQVCIYLKFKFAAWFVTIENSVNFKYDHARSMKSLREGIFEFIYNVNK